MYNTKQWAALAVMNENGTWQIIAFFHVAHALKDLLQMQSRLEQQGKKTTTFVVPEEKMPTVI